MDTSEAVFRALLSITLTLAVILLALFPFQEPGSEGRVISIMALSVQGVMILIAGAGLYFGWKPFGFLDET
ncbi:hypothetical protein C477_17170 [Haloterrigena salina JCM 13891]|uniref:Uncharacterized protein n=1 Tax=Haloterrigena salina JCM 13891 TaxID=1227488 RepID=M0BWU7_9EURY|nr:hypothetical protein [Haloterrigena salina]ELZ15435.1 hypothetical protein C477_17170 [Haloterrigena salina JCM 13891]